MAMDADAAPADDAPDDDDADEDPAAPAEQPEEEEEDDANDGNEEGEEDNEYEALEQPLDDELRGAAADTRRRLREEQRKVIDSLDLSQYALFLSLSVQTSLVHTDVVRVDGVWTVWGQGMWWAGATRTGTQRCGGARRGVPSLSRIRTARVPRPKRSGPRACTKCWSA
jgi:hypothetical protein